LLIVSFTSHHHPAWSERGPCTSSLACHAPRLSAGAPAPCHSPSSVPRSNASVRSMTHRRVSPEPVFSSLPLPPPQDPVHPSPFPPSLLFVDPVFLVRIVVATPIISAHVKMTSPSHVSSGHRRSTTSPLSPPLRTTAPRSLPTTAGSSDLCIYLISHFLFCDHCT
jgi:hypothetical protein